MRTVHLRWYVIESLPKTLNIIANMLFWDLKKIYGGNDFSNSVGKKE